jgi:3-dehydroquinate dehydratase
MGFVSNISVENDEITIEDLSKEHVQTAYDTFPQGVSSAIAAHRNLGHLQLNLMGANSDDESVSEELFNSKAAYLIYDWVARHIAERSLILGLKAEYTIASVLLRTSLEAHMTGIFTNSLSDTEFRESFREDCNSKTSSEIQEAFDFADPWQVINMIEREDLESTARILDIINETSNQGIHEIHNGWVRDLLFEYGYFNPKPDGEIKQLYSQLSSSVHAHIGTTLANRSNKEGGHPFNSPTHVEDDLSRFLSEYFAVMDTKGVLMLNEFEDDLENYPEAQSLINQSNYGFRSLNLTDTDAKLEQISSRFP